MKRLNFKIETLNFTKVGDFTSIPFQTNNEVECIFDFQKEMLGWTKCKAVAIFENNKIKYPVAITKDKKCLVPKEIMSKTYFRIQILFATDKVRVYTNKLLITKEG